MQQPFANAPQSGGALCAVPMIVDPSFAENSDATLRAIRHGSSFQAPSAQPSESITRRFTSWTTAGERSSNCRVQAKLASWWARVVVIGKVKQQCGDESPRGNSGEFIRAHSGKPCLNF